MAYEPCFVFSFDLIFSLLQLIKICQLFDVMIIFKIEFIWIYLANDFSRILALIDLMLYVDAHNKYSR